MAIRMNVLALNVGSSSIKIHLYEMEERQPIAPPRPRWTASAAWDGTTAVLERLLADLPDASSIDAAGHRVVQGGAEFREPVLITPAVRQAIERIAEIAPVHNARACAVIDAASRMLDGVPHVAVFDTAFHATLPPAAYTYPGPYDWLARGIRRYGFHGLNHQYAAMRASEMLQVPVESLRIVTCHLGSGCSLCAIRNGVSTDTTMGFTPLEGLMMASRSGSIDPGILLHLLRREGMTIDELDHTLNQESGLKGISGISPDVRDILAAAEGNERARLALDIFAHRLRSAIGSMAVSAGGLDVLVFSGGIGENAPAIRTAACDGLEFLGVRLDQERNAAQEAGDRPIEYRDSRVRVLIVKAQEEWQIAKECWRLLGSSNRLQRE